MSLQSKPVRHGNGRCLLALDAGGSRAISQLKILAEIMHRFNYDAKDGEKKRPCDIFDLIGGTGSGGFIGILLAVLGLTADQAMEEFIDLNVNILDLKVDAEARTAALEKHIGALLEKHRFGRDRCLLDSINRRGNCKLIVPVSYRQNIGTPCILRNFESRQEKTTNLTIAQALIATLAMPPLFTSASMRNEFATFEYIGGDISRGNPIREVISEAYAAFGLDEQVACILSLGSGHLGIIGVPDDSKLADWNRVLERLLIDGEREALHIDSQMGHLGIYHRLHVSRGLQSPQNGPQFTPGDILAHTAAYLSSLATSRTIELCVNSMKLREGAASLNQLKHSGSQTLPPTPLPPLTKAFVIRKAPQKFIEKAILGTEEVYGPRMLAVTGIGGCGKTQLILKFMRDHKNRFGSMVFIDGSSAARIRADIIRHVRCLDTVHSRGTFDECLLFLSHPTSKGPRLLVYDNVDDQELDLLPLLPKGDESTIIITSRNRSLGSFCPEAHLELEQMATEEATELLLYPATNANTITEQAREDALVLAAALGCLPIALQQARSYMYQVKCSPKAYLERLRASRLKLLAQSPKYQLDTHHLSTYAAFEASFGKLDLRSRKLLRLLSFLHWSKFPLELIALAAKHDFSKYEYTYIEHRDDIYAGQTLLKEIFLVEDEWHVTNLDNLILLLQNYSLVTLIPGVGTNLVETHPLLHEWVRYSISEEDQPGYESAGVLLLALGDREGYTPSLQYLASHITHLSYLWSMLNTDNAIAFGRIMRNTGHLKDALLLQEKAVSDFQGCGDQNAQSLICPQWELARTYMEAGQFQDAETLQVEILKRHKEVLGERHPDTVMAANNLASTYHDLGRLKEAEELREEVLELQNEILGERHPDTIMATSNLAWTYRQLGRLKEAEVLQEGVLRLRKEILGERHPDTVSASNDLAWTYCQLGRLKEAEVLQEEVLRLRKEILGLHHPDTIGASNNLAWTYRQLGRLKEAEVLQEEVLRLRKEILGEHHPNTISASNNLAWTLHDLGRYKEAEVLQEGVLRLRGKILGERHPDTVSATSNLAWTYCQLGRLKEAEVLQEEVLRLQKEILGERHPYTINTSNNLANTYSDQGRLKEAKVLQEEVFLLRKEVLGEHHPDTLDTSGDLAHTYCHLGYLDEAESLEKDLLKRRRETFGERHHDTLYTASNLAVTYLKMGRIEEAETLQTESFRLIQEVRGERHPETCRVMLNLAETYEALGRIPEALDLLHSVDTIISETLGMDHPLYRRCQRLKSCLSTSQDSISQEPASLLPALACETSLDTPPNVLPGLRVDAAPRRSKVRELLHRLQRPFS